MVNLIGFNICSGISNCNSTNLFVPIVLIISGVIAAFAIGAFVMIITVSLMGCGGAGGISSRRRVNNGAFY